MFDDAVSRNGNDEVNLSVAARNVPRRPHLQLLEGEGGEDRFRDGGERNQDLYRDGGGRDAVERPTASTTEAMALAAEVDRRMRTPVDGGPGESKLGQSQGREGDDDDGGGGGGEPAVPPESTDTPTSVVTGEAPASEETSVPGGGDPSAAGARGSIGSAAAGGDGRGAVGGIEGDLGFFGGTARLALSPDAVLQQVLHPALAPPSCLPSFGGDADTRAQVPSAAGATSHGGMEGASSAVNEIESERLSVAAAAEGVAAVLPPTMVLESCLLAPLREHCRLASSSCLGVFAQELGIVRLVGRCTGLRF